MDFTVLGDHVNVAAHLCSAAKPHQTLATAVVIEAATGSDPDLPLTSRALDPITVKGKSAPLRVYDIQPASQAVSRTKRGVGAPPGL